MVRDNSQWKTAKCTISKSVNCGIQEKWIGEIEFFMNTRYNDDVVISRLRWIFPEKPAPKRST